MYKAIEINPLDLIKALPAEFWVEVPTWDKRHLCAGLADFKSVPDRARGRGWQKRVSITPPLAKAFPPYKEFFELVVSPERSPKRHYEFSNGNPAGAQHDWTELVIGKARKRYACDVDNGQSEWVHTHEVLNGEWCQRDLYHALSVAGLSYQANTKIREECFMEKKMASLWNRLRKQYRRELAVDLPIVEAAQLAAKVRAVEVTNAKMAAGAHVAKLIDELGSYKGQIESGFVKYSI
jgi:hypothetical protein